MGDFCDIEEFSEIISEWPLQTLVDANQSEAEWSTTILMEVLEVDNSIQPLNHQLQELVANRLALKQSRSILCKMKRNWFLAASHNPGKLRQPKIIQLWLYRKMRRLTEQREWLERFLSTLKTLSTVTQQVIQSFWSTQSQLLAHQNLVESTITHLMELSLAKELQVPLSSEQTKLPKAQSQETWKKLITWGFNFNDSKVPQKQN